MYPAIEIENLSKCYRLGSRVSGFPTLRETLTQGVSAFFQRMVGKNSARENTDLWALDDVSFQVKEGDVVGIVGRNGAGKSTLLKILSRITEPTKGRIVSRGRIASLLEVGTGFHPELTGRENIFLNGAILGMGRQEIKRKFDEIVDFAQIEKFIDTPVKRYSSGMFVRLAFSVAAHLEPDILVIDEILAVGDPSFQKKCIGTMRQVASRNRTVLFVTHNLSMVRNLCNRAILLDAGKLTKDGSVDEVLSGFVKNIQVTRDLSNEGLSHRKSRTTQEVQVQSLSFADGKGQTRWSFQEGETFKIRVQYKALQDIPGLGVFLAITPFLSHDVVTSIRRTFGEVAITKGAMDTVEIEFPRLMLRPGDYNMYLSLSNPEFTRMYDCIDESMDIAIFSVSPESHDEMRREGYFSMPVTVSSQLLSAMAQSA